MLKPERNLESETLVVLQKRGAEGVYFNELAKVLGTYKAKASDVLEMLFAPAPLKTEGKSDVWCGQKSWLWNRCRSPSGA